MSEAEQKKFLEDVARRPGVHKLPSGLLFKILKPVTDPEAPSPRLGTACDVHYHGTLINGKVFDSSIDRGAEATFYPAQVIKGWKEALQLMGEGEEWEVYLPHELAYGPTGAGENVPPYATLIFKIILVKVLRKGKTTKEAHAELEKLTGKKYLTLTRY